MTHRPVQPSSFYALNNCSPIILTVQLQHRNGKINTLDMVIIVIFIKNSPLTPILMLTAKKDIE